MSPRKPTSKPNTKNQISQDCANDLLCRVEQPIAAWIKNKGYVFKTLTIKKAAKKIGISEEDLRNYLKYIVKNHFHPWLDELRVEDAKLLMTIRGSVLGYNDVGNVGYRDIMSFYNSFKKVVGVYPSTWILEKMPKQNSSSEQIPDEVIISLKKVKSSLERWEREMGYRRRNLTVYGVAKALSVTKEELSSFCLLVHMDSIENWIERQRIYDAKIILRSEPERGILSLSDMLGFTSISSFRNSFHKLTGMTPEAWRGEDTSLNLRNATNPQKEMRISSSFDEEPIVQWKRKKGYCQSNLSQKDVARQIGFSDTRFSQYLKKVVKTSFANWINEMRIEEAKRLLENEPSMTVQQVAAKVGFAGKANFHPLFRQFTGMTLEAWRHNHD